MIRVHIETRSSVMRAGLEAVLAADPGIELVDSAAEADVVLCEELNGSASGTVVLLSDDVAPARALRSGVRAALPRHAPPAQIVAALHAAAAGLVVAPAEEFTALAPASADPAVSEPLTARETEVLEMLAEGMSNKMIAYRLSISENTAKFHVNSILAKLHAGTRTEAVTRGLRLGLLKL